MYTFSSFQVGSTSVRTFDEDDGRISNQVRRDDYRTNGKLKAKGSTFEGNVDARDGITFTNVVALRAINSPMGSIEAENSKLNSVKARDGAELSDTTASNIQVPMGKLIWTNDKLSEIPAENIDARDGIKLTNVSCQGTIKCSMGEIKAKNASLNQVLGRDGVQLIDSSAQTVKVDMGVLTVENANPGSTFQQLIARDGIQLQNIEVCGSVTCNMGKIKAQNCQLNTVSSRDGIALFNSTAKSCQVAMGNLFISAKERLVYQQLSARDDIFLENIEAKNSVKSKLGTFNAINCVLPEIHAAEQIKLVCTLCNSATLMVPKDKKGVIILEDSIIEGDLVIEVIENSGSGIINCSSRISGGSGMSVTQRGSSFQISVGDLSYLKFMSVNNGSTGVVNGMPYKYVNREFIPLSSANSESKPSNEIEIEIRGNGTIKGNVSFRDCKGKVTLSSEANIIGNIQ